MTLEHYMGFRKQNIYLLPNFGFICLFVLCLTTSVFAPQKILTLLSSTKAYFVSPVLYIQENAKNFSSMHHFSGCNELFLNSESSLGAQPALEKNQLSSTHRFDIAKCILNHMDLTVKCLSPLVKMIMESGNNKYHFLVFFSKTLNMCSKLLPILEITDMGEKKIYESYLVHRFWKEKGTGEAKPQTLMRLGFGLGCWGAVWGVCFKQYFLISFSVVVIHLSCISSHLSVQYQSGKKWILQHTVPVLAQHKTNAVLLYKATPAQLEIVLACSVIFTIYYILLPPFHSILTAFFSLNFSFFSIST